MKTLVKQVKKLKKASIGISILGVVILIASAVFVTCHQDEIIEQKDQGIEYPIPENAKVITELIGIDGVAWWREPQKNADYISVGQSAQLYSLPHNIKDYNKYVKLIRSGGKNGTILKVTIGDKVEGINGYIILKVEETDDLKEKADLEVIYGSMTDANTAEPIIKVDHLDPSAVERINDLHREFDISLNKEKRTETRSSSLSNDMTLYRAQQFFNQFENLTCMQSGGPECIPFQYATDGCYARAHYMRKLMADAGYDCQKIFAFAESRMLSSNTKAGCCVEWGYHVAPLVIIDRGTYNQQMVIDPSLFSGPVSRSTWVNKLKENCKGSGIPQIQEVVKPSKVYIRLKNGYTIYDNNYSKTMATMSGYSNLSGCN